MHIALFGASGMIGQRILQEALARGHQVTALVRSPAKLTSTEEYLNVKEANVLDSTSVAQAVSGHEVVVSAIGPGSDQPETAVVEAARALLKGVAQAGVPRLLVVGGAGGLEVAPGVKLMDTPEFLPAWKSIAQAHVDAFAVYQKETNLNWTYLSPAALIAPGQRTGQYRTATDTLVIDEKGESRISAEDFAVAMLDEVEKPQFARQRFTVAY